MSWLGTLKEASKSVKNAAQSRIAELDGVFSESSPGPSRAKKGPARAEPAGIEDPDVEEATVEAPIEPTEASGPTEEEEEELRAVDETPPAVSPVAEAVSQESKPEKTEVEMLREQLQERERQLENQMRQMAGLHEFNARAGGEGKNDAEMAAVKEEFTQRLAKYEQRLAQLTAEKAAAIEQLAAKGDAQLRADALMAEGLKLQQRMLAHEETARTLREERRVADAAAKKSKADGEKAVATMKSGADQSVYPSRPRLAFLFVGSDTFALALTLFGCLGHLRCAALRPHRALRRAEGERDALGERLGTALAQLQEAQEGLEQKRGDAAHLGEAAASLAVVRQRVEDLERDVVSAGRDAEGARRSAASAETRLAEAESRNEALAASIPEATRPLMRQVEAMQAAASSRDAAVQAAELSMTKRLAAAEERVVVASTRASDATGELGSVQTQLAAAESELLSLRDTATRLNRDAAAALARLQVAETVAHEAGTRVAEATARVAESDARVAALESAAAGARAETEREVVQLQAVIEQERRQRRDLVRELDDLRSHRAAMSQSNGAPATPPTAMVGSVPPSPSGGAPHSLPALQLAELSEANADMLTALPMALREQYRSRVAESDAVLRRGEAERREHSVLLERFNTMLVLLGEKDELVDDLRDQLKGSKAIFAASLESALAGSK